MNKEKFNITIDLLICISVVVAIYSHTINRPWIFYDESSIYLGTHFPTPKTITEIFEIIQNFGLNFNLVSSNYIYSSNYVTRTSPFGQLLGTILSLLFKKTPFLWHLFNLTMHLINSFLIFLILKTFLIKGETKEVSVSVVQRIVLVLLTLIWAVHPVNIEPVLLATNFGALFSYMFFFGFLLDFFLNRKKNKSSLVREFLIPIIFLIPMLTNEYIVTMPLVLFVISFWINFKEWNFKKALNLSFKETKPYFYGLVLYCLYFVFLTSFKTSYSLEQNSLIAFLERIFWLSPQIFFHLVKLVLIPLRLSIDQSIFVKLGDTIYDPYSLFCILFLALWLALPLFYFLKYKKLSNIFMITWTFFFALMPFLHILMPSYTLAAERYLYVPLMLLVLGIGIVFSDLNIKSQKLTSISVPSLLSVILLFCLCRLYIRTQDWKSNEAFINSTYKTSNNALFEGIRLGMLGKILSVNEPHKIEEVKDYFKQALYYLEAAKRETEEKKLALQDKLPSIIKTYGLDYNSLLKKILYLQASTIYLDLKGDYKEALSILESQDKSISLDPPYAELYSHLLIADKNLKKAEDILLQAFSQYPKSDTVIKNLIDFYMFSNKDSTKAEKYLQHALKLFLYEPNILLKAVSFYQEQNNLILTAKYAYLHALRTGSKVTYQIALSNFLASGNQIDAKKVLSKLLKLDPNDPITRYFVSKYYYQKS